MPNCAFLILRMFMQRRICFHAFAHTHTLTQKDPPIAAQAKSIMQNDSVLIRLIVQLRATSLPSLLNRFFCVFFKE